MKTHDFVLSNADTDSIMISKKDGSPFPEEERKELLAELNSIFPENIEWADDGYFPSVVILKAKNYILYDGEKIKKKGSSLKSSKTEPALKQFMSEVIDCLLFNKTDQLVSIYNKHVIQAANVQDIGPYCSKKTITEKVLNPKRTNEQKILDALKGRHYQMGDKALMYYKHDGSLSLKEDWQNDHDPIVLISKLYKTLCIFENVIDINQFTKYSLKGKRKDLETLLTGADAGSNITV